MEKTLSIDPTTLSIPERHGYLLSAVAPRPIAFASTIDEDGNVNLSPFSFFNVFSSNPPIMIFSPARSGKDNTTKHTLQNVQKIKECVISIVNYPMVQQMSLSSSQYPKGVNEFVKAGFTQISSTKVRPPRVGESPVSFECVVNEIIELGTEGAAGNLVICEVIQIHIIEKYLNEQGRLDTKKLDLVSRMGGIWYCRAQGDALFQIEKPLAKPGIGVDALPTHVLASKILTGNDLGILGNIESIPTESEIIKIKAAHNLDDSNVGYGDPEAFKNNVHHLAKEMINAGRVKEALTVLFCV